MLASRPALDLGREGLRGPVLRGTRGVLEFGDLYFEVDPEVGGRVVCARVGGLELLVGPAVHPANYGSTFWTSPQNGEFGWGWPPVAAIDSAAFRLSELENGFEVAGPPVIGEGSAAVAGLSVSKRFLADVARGAIHIEYAIRNDGPRALAVAPWEITRVAPGGLSFYAGDEPPTGEHPLEIVERAGCYWYRHTGDSPPHGKVFGDGRGWIAHLSREGALLVKRFDDLEPHQFAPGEAEIEIYASPQESPAAAYVEVENQGPFTEISPSSTFSWRVVWYLRTLPAEIPSEPSQALVELVQQTIQ